MITLATLPQATEQEVFNQVVRHLKQQNKQASYKHNCMYRLPHSNLKCAAGCLIGDDEYSPQFERTGWHTLSRRGLVPEAHKTLISKLQSWHDSDHYYLDRFKGIAKQLKDLAFDRGLEWLEEFDKEL